MKSSVKLSFCRWDLLVAVVVIALAVACAAMGWIYVGGSGEGSLVAVVSIDETETDRITFSETGGAERSYTNNGYTLQVWAENGEVRVSQADCPNQDCVHTGLISRPGESIVCLPARISIQLIRQGGSADGDLDAVIG